MNQDTVRAVILGAACGDLMKAVELVLAPLACVESNPASASAAGRFAVRVPIADLRDLKAKHDGVKRSARMTGAADCANSRPRPNPET